MKRNLFLTLGYATLISSLLAMDGQPNHNLALVTSIDSNSVKRSMEDWAAEKAFDDATSAIGITFGYAMHTFIRNSETRTAQNIIIASLGSIGIGYLTYRLKKWYLLNNQEEILQKIFAPIRVYNENLAGKNFSIIQPIHNLFLNDYNDPRSRLAIYKAMIKTYPDLIQEDIIHEIGRKLRTITRTMKEKIDTDPETLTAISDQSLTAISNRYQFFRPFAQTIQRNRDFIYNLQQRMETWNAFIILSNEHKIEVTQSEICNLQIDFLTNPLNLSANDANTLKLLNEKKTKYTSLSKKIDPDLKTWISEETGENFDLYEKELPKSIGKEEE